MSHPDFTTLELGDVPAASRSTGEAWIPAEEIPVSPAYGAGDVSGLDFTGSVPGAAPFVRGPYPTMYVQRP